MTVRSSILLAVLAAGCMVGPNYRRPDVVSPPSWGELAPTARGPRAGGAIQPGELLAQHLARFTQLPRVGEHDPAGHVPHQEVGADRDRS